MRKFLSCLALILSINHNSEAQIIDRMPTGTNNILPVEGGSITMKVDSITPLRKLIGKLNGNWRFIETGKGYWIGYTNDMFSIASRGDEAIPALVHFFKTTKNEQGKIGAIYTLHLIGIQRKIVGRFSERFVNPEARIALLDLLKEKDYTYWIVKLLMRDPWQSDIPYFFEILRNETDEKLIWPIINSLNRYQIQGLPLNGQLSQSLNDLEIKLLVENENVLEDDFDFNNQIKEALRGFSSGYPKLIKVEANLYDENLTPYYKTKLSSSLSIRGLLSSLGIEEDDPFSYMQIGCKLQYYLENGAINFCTMQTARDRLNSWWDKLTAEGKAKFKK